MFGVNLGLVTFCFLASVSRIHCASPSPSFARIGNYYESIFKDSAVTEQASIGYVEVIRDIVAKYDRAEVSFQELNKFGQGLDQLFLFKFLKKIYEDETPNYIVNESADDAFTIPDFKDDVYGLVFKDLVAYSFPAYKKGSKPKPSHDALSSASEYKISNRYTSDNFILVGSVYIEGQKYFFLYRVSNPVYFVEVQMRRNPEQLIFSKKSLSYEKEDYVHVYDSSYDNSTTINSILNETVANKLLPHVLNELSKRNAEELKYQAFLIEKDFIKTYERLLLNGLGISALKFIKGYVQANNGNDTFAASDIVFNVDSPTAPLPFQQKAINIRFKGFLNYVNPPNPVFENTSLSDGGRLYNMSQGIEFLFAETGDKTGVVSFDIVSGRREFHKEFKVKSMTMVSEYLGEMNKKPLTVYRNKEVFFNGAGFLCRLLFYDEDPMYEYVYRHLCNDIARKIQDHVEKPSTAQ